MLAFYILSSKYIFSCALLVTSCCCLYHLSADDETSNVLKRSVKNVRSRFGSLLYIKIIKTFQSLCSVSAIVFTRNHVTVALNLLRKQ